MKIITSANQQVGQVNPLIYGHFLEHFQRQVYGGVYDPTSRFADEDGFRTDVLEALRNIKPIEDCYEWAYNNGWNGVLAWTDRDLLDGDGVPQYACVKLAGERMTAIENGTYVPAEDAADAA